MNAKQLIEAAKEVLSSRDPACSHIWNAHRSCQWCHRDRRDVYVDDIARHILSTVREDDDEPVTREWLASLGADIDTDAFRPYIRYAIRQSGDEQLVMTLFVSGGQVFLNDRIIAFAETRGEFRSLLRGLRVPFNK